MTNSLCAHRIGISSAYHSINKGALKNILLAAGNLAVNCAKPMRLRKGTPVAGKHNDKRAPVHAGVLAVGQA